MQYIHETWAPTVISVKTEWLHFCETSFCRKSRNGNFVYKDTVSVYCTLGTKFLNAYFHTRYL